MAWLIETKQSIHEFMTELCIYSIYGFGSINDLLNMKIYELWALKQCCKDDEVKEIFKKVKMHNFD